MIKITDSFYEDTTEVTPTYFPDGTCLMKFEPTNSPYTIDWLYDDDSELFQIIALTKHLKSFGADVNLYMPYVPNARMDRVKQSNEVFTLKAFADVINWLGFSCVTICNPHSTVSEALFDRVHVDFDCVYEDVDKVLKKIGGNPDDIVFFFPDQGAAKRYGDILKPFFYVPVAFGVKNRSWQTGEILGLDVVNGEAVKGKRVLIVDDISSRGTTFVKSAEKLKELGAKNVYLYVTHCEKTILEGDVLKGDLIDTVFTTNSIFRGQVPKKMEIVREF